MERFLVYDAGCSKCSHTASVVRYEARNMLKTLSIYDAEARMLLDSALPGGWEHAPYLVVIEKHGVHAWTGLAMGLRLLFLVGPHGAYRIWTKIRRSGIRLFGGSEVTPHSGVSRRSFLRLIAGLGAVVGFGLVPSKVAAACADPAYEVCVTYERCVGVSVCGFNPPQTFYCDHVTCSDYRNGYPCDEYYSNCTCGSCPS